MNRPSPFPHRILRRASRQRGTAAVEFAIAGIVLLVFIFGVLEMSRMLFVWNTMNHVTNRAARAAAMVKFSDTAAKDALRGKAMFLNDQGKLILGGGIGPEHLRIDYLGPQATPVSSAPSCTARNAMICLNDPNDSRCVRFVRVRLCQPGTDCQAVPFAPMVSLGAFDALNFDMPPFTAVAPVEALGQLSCP